jgi:shikimate kinase
VPVANDDVEDHRQGVILIGPIGAGKSTVGKLLAERLGVPQVAMDSVRFGYYKEIGYDEALADELGRREGFASKYRYWKPFEIYAVERVLSDHRDCVIDFGGGHSVYEDDALFERARRALAPYANVVLLLPSPDLDESVRVLRERRGGPIIDHGLDFDEHFVKHHSNHDLATLTVYTKDQTADQTCAEILRRLPTMPANTPDWSTAP